MPRGSHAQKFGGPLRALSQVATLKNWILTDVVGDASEPVKEDLENKS